MVTTIKKRGFFQMRRNVFSEIPPKHGVIIIKMEIDSDEMELLAENGEYLPITNDMRSMPSPKILTRTEGREYVNMMNHNNRFTHYKILPYRGDILESFAMIGGLYHRGGYYNNGDDIRDSLKLAVKIGKKFAEKRRKDDVIQIRAKKSTKPKPKRCSCKKK